MAVDVCSEISSPRISFSHDLKEVVESLPPHPSLLNPTIDFDFCIHQTFISSADELFANGKILPVQIKNITVPTKNDVAQEENTKKKRLIEFLSTSFDEDENKQRTKPFWQFRRSNSVNSNGLIGRSLQFLTRSNSTGSVPNPNPKVMQKQHSLKESSINHRQASSSSLPGFNRYYPYNNSNSNGNSNKPYLRTSNSRSYVNGVGINPVLNITPTYIAKGTVSLFGIGSFFSSKKKSKKKRK